MKRGLMLAAIGLAAFVISGAAGRAEEAKFVCSRDVWVSGVPTGDEGQDERDTSMGKTPKLKIKTIQEMALLDFDLAALKGKVVDGGWLYFNIEDNPVEVARLKLPFERKHLLKRIGLSTVSADWEEGAAAEEYKVDKAGFGATFRWASYSKRPWAWPGSDLTDVTMSNGNTLQHHAVLEDQKDMWARVKVPPELIQSLIARDGYGWLIMDEIGQGLVNNFIYSRETAGKEPYLVVNVAGEDTEAPAAPKVTVAASPADAHLDSGAIAIDVAGAPNTFCWFVTVNGRAVPRWQVPHPKAGAGRIVLDDLKGGEGVTVEVVAADAAGNRAAAVVAKGQASSALAAPPALPAAWTPKPGDAPVRSDKLRVWAFPEISKVDPATGALFEALKANRNALEYKRANSVWNGADNSVRIFGAQGEIVSFQLCLEKVNKDDTLADIAISLDGLDALGDDLRPGGPGKIGVDRVRLFRVWYVGGAAEYADPMAAGQKLSIPMADNAVTEQNNQAVIVDIAVPKDAPADLYTGAIKISAAGVKEFTLPLAMQVYGFTVPDKMRFNPELNIYGAPGSPGSKTFFEAYRVAHYNRCTLSITQSGHSDGVKTPVPIAGAGKDVRVQSWQRYDESFGPLLDGSAFKGLPREGTPVATLHIPMSHGFPLPIDRYYKYTGQKRGDQIGIIHALLCDPIEQSFGDDYKEGFQSFARQFVKHFEEKGWTETECLFYLDGKVQYRVKGNGTSYWLLDEPYNYDDWMALRFWGKLFMDGIKGEPKKTHWSYRCDISRPQWTRDWLNGVMTHMYAGGLTREIRRCQIMAKEGPMAVYSYGSCNRPADSHWNSTAWCLTTFLAGGDGVLPWQSLANTRDADPLKTPDPHGLIVLDKLGKPAIGSIRIMALRRGAQDCEYLLTLGEKYGLNREQLRRLVTGVIADKATLKQVNEDDAAPVTFDDLDADKFARLREGIAKLIEQKK